MSSRSNMMDRLTKEGVVTKTRRINSRVIGGILVMALSFAVMLFHGDVVGRGGLQLDILGWLALGTMCFGLALTSTYERTRTHQRLLWGYLLVTAALVLLPLRFAVDPFLVLIEWESVVGMLLLLIGMLCFSENA